jgi:hypothetical protein
MPGQEDRAYWVSLADRLSRKVLPALAAGELRKSMPVESGQGAWNRDKFTHLEAFGRLLAGLAPWLESESPVAEPERDLKNRTRRLALEALEKAVHPASPDFLNFSAGQQPLVDAAFLCSALLRAPQFLLGQVKGALRGNLIEALKITRAFKPYQNNWILFSALVEAGLAKLGADWQEGPIDTALQSHEDWYLGDGTYGDGPVLAWDYYNSYVIHPMILELLQAMEPFSGRWASLKEGCLSRARRYAEVQERLISPEGTYPPLGRSISYRAGAFHLLAYAAWKGLLPPALKPAQVRCALSAVLRRQMEAKGTFDSQGWLSLGFAGHQPGLAESYISTGSTYLVSLVLLPLGLGPEDDFWSGADEAWTAKKLWEGQDMPPDKATNYN